MNERSACIMTTHGTTPTPELRALQLTLCRIPVGLVLLGLVLQRNVLSLAALGAFVALDVLDGAVARKAIAETPLRRLVDGCIDRAFIGLCLVAGALTFQPDTLVPVMIILGREIVLAIWNLVLLTRRMVFSGTGVHRLTSIGYAMLGSVIVLAPASMATMAAWAVAAFSLATYVVYQRAQQVALSCAGSSRRRRLVIVSTTGLDSSVAYPDMRRGISATSSSGAVVLTDALQAGPPHRERS